MALFCAKNGQLQTLKGVFECRPQYFIEIWDTLKEKRGYTNGVPTYLNIDGTKVIVSLSILASESANRHMFNIYIDGVYVANADGYQGTLKIWNISSVSGKPAPNLNSSAQVNTYEFYPTFTYVNGTKKDGYISQIRLRQYWSSDFQYMTYRRIYREGSYDFVPCKLIEEIPSVFAYDNKVHYANEVGWWNKYNQKFYPNTGGEVMNGLVETITIS